MDGTEPDAESRYTYDLSPRETPSEGVVAAVSTATGRDPVSTLVAPADAALDPLYNVVDPDALDTLFRSTEEPSVSVIFSYHDHEVTIDGRGRITVAPLGDTGGRGAE